MVGKLTPDTVMSCSRLPAILGLSPYASPNDELARTIDALEGRSSTWAGTEAAEWGNRLEPVILETMVERLGLDVLHVPTTPYAAPDGIQLNASLDGVGSMVNPGLTIRLKTDPDKGIYVVGQNEIVLKGAGVLESKLTNSAPEDVPAPYRGPIQLQGCMLCTGYEWGAIGVLYRGTELRIFVYARDEARIAEIISAVDEFERRKQGPDWYPPVSTADAARTWSNAEPDAPPVNLPTDAVDLIDDLIVARETIKAAEEIAEVTQAALMELLGNHTEGLATDRDGTVYRVRWPSRTYKPQPAKTTPAKAGYTVRQKTLDIKVLEPA